MPIFHLLNYIERYKKAIPSEHVKDYITLSDCYDVFNKRLFGGKLRESVLTFEDRCQYFAIVGKAAPPIVATMAAALPFAGEPDTQPPKTPSKVDYECPECGMKVWGKPHLSLICGECHGIDGQILHLVVSTSYHFTQTFS